MMIIGLTGGIGSGKTTVAQLFATHGIPVIDTDEIAHQLTTPGAPLLSSIQQQFGPDIILDNGQLNRAALAERIFHDQQARLQLEQLLHPAIWQEVNHQLEQLHTEYCLIVVPLLLETGQSDRVDRILVVDTTEALQVQRTRARDQRSEQDIKAIMQAQVSRQTRLQAADDIIDNTDSADSSLDKQVEALHQKYLQLAKHQLT